MPLITESYDSLPYIDPTPTPDALTAAQSLIHADMDPTSTTTSTPHPSLLPALNAYTPHFSPLISQEHARLDASPSSKITNGIDTTRYESLDPPPTSSDESSHPERLAQEWRHALQQAYTSQQYISGRVAHLHLVETFGKNAWLVGNAQLEAMLKGLERELAEVRRQREEVGEGRRGLQERVGGEMGMLEEGWRKGVGRVLEAEVAAERLKSEILEERRRRTGAGGGGGA